MRKTKTGYIERLIDGLHSALYLAVMLAVLSACGWLIAGPDGALLTAAAPLVLMFFLPRIPARSLMRMRRSVPIESWRAPEIHRMISLLSRRAGLEREPALYWDGSALINAFTAGHAGDAAIALSDGALKKLPPRELEGVLAHEIAHIAAGDVRLGLFAATVHSAASAVANVGLLFCVLYFLSGGGADLPLWLPIAFALAPAGIALLHMALSRRREFAADALGAELTGDPHGLASALAIIGNQEDGLWRRIIGTAMPVLEPALLRSHPPTEERVRRLLGMGRRERPMRYEKPTTRIPAYARQPVGFRSEHPAVVAVPRVIRIRRPGWHGLRTWF